MSKYKVGEIISPLLNTYGRLLPAVFLLAKLGQAHGVHGAIKYQILGNSKALQLFKKEKFLLLDANKNFVKEVKINIKGTDKTSFLEIDGVSRREEAEHLRHFYLALPREKMPALDEGVYYVEDLLGCTLVSSKRGNFGILTDVLQNNGQDVYQIDRSALNLKPLYFVDDGHTIQNIDVERGIIEVELAEGLWEIYDN